ncbi:hypothetical protein L596_014403 [Steinernema carpocapsae]|uniref:Uncharacterized protein n=1 Tax=Steinernema carpocapsae TaxID=34508 RepID=A0A4U5NCE4_STECR|nr:hypothetical protein L596_014403 [Steinernema carpocapsae]
MRNFDFIVDLYVEYLSVEEDGERLFYTRLHLSVLEKLQPNVIFSREITLVYDGSLFEHPKKLPLTETQFRKFVNF